MKIPSGVDLPVIRSSERMDYKRCPKRWFWRWRMGLVPRVPTFGALELGQWMHSGLATWYGLGGKRRNGSLAELFVAAAEEAISKAMIGVRIPQEILDKSDELIALGEAMAKAYQAHYGYDSKIKIIRTELPLEYTFSGINGQVIAIHKFKPDAVYLDHNGDIWLLEHKTAKQIQTEHLVIDDQARPYAAMAERALINAGYLQKGQKFRGIMYNFLRKALPDERPQNTAGQYLNQDGSVSKRQPPAYFVRKPVTFTNKAKAITLERVRDETAAITLKTLELRIGELSPNRIPKTQHKSCPKTCPFFDMCVMEENGIDIRDIRRIKYKRQDPYLYEEESTEDPLGFEIA